MTEPFLYFRDIGFVIERICGSRRTQCMRANPFDIDASLCRVVLHNVAIGRALRERLFSGAATRVFHRSEEGTGVMTGEFETICNALQR